MRPTLVDVIPKVERFPDGTASARVRLMFSEGEKTAFISHCAKFVMVNGDIGRLKQEAAYAVTKAIKEAHRDALHAKHGSDWMAYEKPLNLTEQEEAIAKKAVELLTT